jgi:glycerophosphoryl diester phosphodiesterase
LDPTRTTEIIGHRGAPRAYLENTVPSFLCALEAGAGAVELDVHATKDGEVVVHHDPRLERRHLRASHPGPEIAAHTLEELLVYAGDLRERVPRLAEVLSLVDGRATVYVEVKGAGIEPLVVDVIRASRARCAIHAFDHRVAQRVAALAPEIPRGILSASYVLDPAGDLRRASARDYWQHWEMIDAALVDAVHGAGGRVIAWTVNEIADAERLASLGVDGLCSDVSAELVRLGIGSRSHPPPGPAA